MTARELFGSEDTLSQGHNICKEKCTLTFSLAVATLYKDIGIDHTCSLQTMGHQLSLTSGHASPIEDYLLYAEAHLAPTHSIGYKTNTKYEDKGKQKIAKSNSKRCTKLPTSAIFWQDLTLSTETSQSPAILNLIISRVSKESAYSVFLAVLVYRYLSALYPRHLSILCFFWRHISTSSEKKRGDMCVFTFTDKSSIVMKRCKIKYQQGVFRICSFRILNPRLLSCDSREIEKMQHLIGEPDVM